MTISPDRILKELAELWVHEGAGSGSSVLRACSMTLIVFAEEDAATIGETVAALMPEHPARTVHIQLSGKQGRALSERVYQQCWMPFGQRRQICCEQVEITASDEALGDLPSVVLPLAVADLPVIVWCRSLRLLGMPEFDAIAAMATKVIVDSAAVPDALGRLVEASRRGVVLGDLAWTRLTRWREMLSQVFENRERLGQLSRVERMKVEYGAGYETSARYLAAWIGTATGHAGMTAGMASGTLALRVVLEGEGLRVELSCNDGTLVVTVNELSHSVRLAHPNDYLLMREELSIVRRDAVFERTLEAAAR